MTPETQKNDSRVRPITIAILALGGEGGGVLTDWIIDLAEHVGYWVQKTSVPGVAQRTGATVYYVELLPKSANGQKPVLALLPVPGDVDIVLASEFMEAGRAITRGLVTPDRTTLITSTHRVYTMQERIAIGDERVDSNALLASCRESSATLYAFDMSGMAESAGSLVTAVMFGVLAASKALPFPRSSFEDTIRRGGVGIESSIRAFNAGFDAGEKGATGGEEPQSGRSSMGETLSSALTARVTDLSQPVIGLGTARLKDYQDQAHADLYLKRLEPIMAIERAREQGSDQLLEEVARFLAVAMSFEDTIRVAELKIKRTRFERVREEVKAKSGEIVEIAEYFHPRPQEIVETVPAPLGRWIMKSKWASGILDRVTRKGYTIKTTSIHGFLLLWLIARMKSMRPRSLRWIAESERHEAWLARIIKVAPGNYALGIEIARCLELVSGYGETHERSAKKFNAIMAALPTLERRPDAALQLEALRKAAAADEFGDALKKQLEVSLDDSPGEMLAVAA